MSLPFPLYKKHKSNCKTDWKRNGMIFVDDAHFEYVYDEYIHATHSDLCNKVFLKTQDRQLDHCYDTCEPRNVVCCRCNLTKKDRKIINGNISKCEDNRAKNGYSFHINIMRDGKRILNTTRNTLEKAIKCRDVFIAANPGIYT